jgi:hypothetical protein
MAAPQGGGGGSGSALGNGAAATIKDWTQVSHRSGLHIIVGAAATGSFKLDVLFSPDNGTTSFIHYTVSDATVVVDGGTALYVSQARLDTPCPFCYKVQIWNDSGGNIDYAYDYREYVEGMN